MAVQQVQVDFDNTTSIVTADAAGRETTEQVLPSYEIKIPVPGRSHPVVIVAFRPSDTSTVEKGEHAGEYADPLVRNMFDQGFSEFHVINDESGTPVTVMMRPMDWAAYQRGLSSFAAAAARSPNLYQPNAASNPLGLFAPQAQAGTTAASAPTPFRPLTAAQMSGMGLQQWSVSLSYGQPPRPLDMMAYAAPNDAARAALRNAGYVEVSMRQTEGTPPNQRTVTIPRFMAPLDARLYQQGSGPVMSFGVPW